MKTLRFLLVVVFVFTVFVSPAYAQGEVSYGYIPLVGQADSSLPLDLQAREIFNLLQPSLLEAQQNGAIGQFTPEFQVGIVRVEFMGGRRESTLGGMEIFGDVNEALAVVSRAQPEIQNAETYSPQFRIFVTSSCLIGHGFIAGDRVNGVLRDTSGSTVAVLSAYANASGILLACFSEPNGYILPGYRASFKVYNSTGTLFRGSYSVVTPFVTFTRLDKANGVVVGTGPVGKSYSLSWSHPRFDAGHTMLVVKKLGTISGTGKWAWSFGAGKFRGGDMIALDMNYGASFIVTREMPVPYFSCGLLGNLCTVTGFPGQPAYITLLHNKILTYTDIGTFDPSGLFKAHFMEGDTAIQMMPNDAVSGPGAASYSLPLLYIFVQESADVVTGNAPANKYLTVYVYDVRRHIWYWKWVKANATGVYVANFSSVVDLGGYTDTYVVYLSFTNPVNGNETHFQKSFGP